MNISELFIRRPVMTTLVMLGILMFGLMAYRLLPVSNLPNVDFPTIQVNASLPGASPETMASAVATPLEKQFSTIAGIDQMTSSSSLGNTNITLQFTLDRDIDAAAQDVQAAISKTLRQLPTGIVPPSYQKVNPADQPIIYYALSSKTLSLPELDEYAETFIAQRLSMVDGVAQVNVFGAAKYAVRIQLDPKALATRSIGIDEVAGGVAAGNVNLPTGILWGPHRAYTVQANGQLQDATAFRPLVIAYRNGAPVRLQDLGQVLDDVQDNKSAAWFNGSRAIVLAIQRQPGTNTVAVAARVRTVMQNLKQQLPGSVDLQLRSDRSESIRASLADVQFTLFLTLALPFSLVGTFAVMYALDYSLDNLSMMALTLSVGFVVDDAIVMLENIVRHMEKGSPPLQAAFAGSREVGFTILSMTLSLAAVFIPVLFMGGIVGRLFHEFAVTIGAAILVSGFVSLTLTPMLGSRFLRHQSKQHGKAYLALERGFDSMLHVYQRGLKWSLEHRRTVIAFSLIVFIAMVPLFVIVPKGFMPSEDMGGIFGITEAREGISFRALVEHQLQVNRVVKQDPNVESFFSSAGSRGGAGGNQGFIFIRLKARDRRKLAADEVVQEMRPKLMREVIGMNTYLQPLQPIRIGGVLTKSLYQFTLQDADTKELYRVAPEMEARMRQLPGLQDVTSDLLIRNPQVNVDIDRDKAASQGVTPQAIEDALYSSYGSRQISTIYAPNNEYQVILELKPEFQGDPNAMGMLYIRSSAGQLVPLSSVATLKSTVGPLSVNHLGQLPAVNISFNLKPGVSLGEAVNAVNRLARQTLPATVSTSFQGTAQAFQSSQQGLGVLLLMAILVIYLVLGILYESFIHPITILSALPLAGFGALVTLLLFRVELSIYAFVGIIMLVGLVKKNGIMMVDFAIEAQRAGNTATEAIYEACVVRFRPIMMTTMAALVGTLPIAMGYGAGAESRRPLGLAVVGGLLFSQMLTLFVTPVTYTYMEQFRAWAARRRAKPEHPPVAVPSP